MSADTYIIELRAGKHPHPPAIRLRQLLKIALRGFGFRCLDIRIIPRSDASDSLECSEMSAQDERRDAIGTADVSKAVGGNGRARIAVNGK